MKSDALKPELKHRRPNKCRSTQSYRKNDDFGLSHFYCVDCGGEMVEKNPRQEPEKTWTQEHAGEIIWVIIAVILAVWAGGGLFHGHVNQNEAPNSDGQQYYCDKYGC